MIELIIPSFIAGILMFLAPCTLPLVPGYLAIISGVSAEDLAHPERGRKAHWKMFINGIFFALGFSIVFILLGTLAGWFGHLLLEYRSVLAQLGGLVIIIFGFMMMDVVEIPGLKRERRFRLPLGFQHGKPGNSMLVGAIFGFGWSPCIGPILGTILFLASTAGTAWQGGFLLGVFSLGLAIPFLIIALAAGSATRYIKQVGKYLHVIQVIGGVFLILLGFLMLVGQMDWLIGFGYKLFDCLHYEQLLDYL